MLSMSRWAGCALLALVVWVPAAPAAASSVPCVRAADVDAVRSESRHPAPHHPRTRDHVVGPGDTLSGLAARFDLAGGWQALYAANRAAVGPDPDLLRPGTRLALPASARVVAPPREHVVAPGDTLSGLAARFDLPGGWRALYAANRAAVGPDPDTLSPGTTLTLRGPPSPSGPDGPAPGSAGPPPDVDAPAAPPTASSPTQVLPRPHVPSALRPDARSGGPAGTAGTADPALPAGLPVWLDTALVVVGLVALAALVTEPVRRRRDGRRAGTTSRDGLTRGPAVRPLDDEAGPPAFRRT